MECRLDKGGREREKFPTSGSLCLRRISLLAVLRIVERREKERGSRPPSFISSRSPATLFPRTPSPPLPRRTGNLADRNTELLLN